VRGRRKLVKSYAGIPYRLGGCFLCGKAALVRVAFEATPNFSVLTCHYPPGWMLSVASSPEGDHTETVCPDCVKLLEKEPDDEGL
jgi:hypothetical protein